MTFGDQEPKLENPRTQKVSLADVQAVFKGGKSGLTLEESPTTSFPKSETRRVSKGRAVDFQSRRESLSKVLSTKISQEG